VKLDFARTGLHYRLEADLARIIAGAGASKASSIVDAGAV
jgi:hypothetical protein